MEVIVSDHIGHYIFFVLAVIALIFGLKEISEEKSIKGLLPVLLSIVMLGYFTIITLDRPSLTKAKQHYMNLQSLEVSDIEKIVIKKRINSNEYKKPKIVLEKEVIKSILFTIQNENKSISEDWGVKNIFSLCLHTKEKEQFFFKIDSTFGEFDVIYMLLEKNNNLITIGTYANDSFRKLNLLD